MVPLLLGMALSSCVTPSIVMEEEPAQLHIDYVLETINGHFGENTSLSVNKAVTLAVRELSNHRFTVEEASAVIVRALDSQIAAYGQSDDPVHLRMLHLSISRLKYLLLEIDSGANLDDYPEPGEPKSDGLWYGDLSSYYRGQGNANLALFYAQKSFRELGRQWFVRHEWAVDELRWYMEQARIFNNRELLEAFMQAHLNRGGAGSEYETKLSEYRGFIDAGWQADLGVEASVTIWVDKGLRFERGIGYPERNIGTGFYVDPDGYIITNYHVISSEVDPEYEGKSELFIRPGDNPQLRIPAKVVGYDKIFDIALLKAETQAPEVLSLQGAGRLRTGSQLYAVGSPGGLENTVTSGIISATGRRFLQLGDSLQIDAPINPGNSGGPLFDARGQLVGVVFAGIEQFEGVNFAIPSNWISLFYPGLFSKGELQHPWLGISLKETRSGLEIIYVAPGSPASQAGFCAGEIIAGINGAPVVSIPQAQGLLLSEPLHSSFFIRLKNPTGANSFRFVYSSERPYSPLKNVLDSQLVNSWLPPLFGMRVADMQSESKYSQYVITDVFPGSVADETGLSKDDPFELINWIYDEEQSIAILQIYIQQKTKGFLREGLQLANYIELNSFL